MGAYVSVRGWLQCDDKQLTSVNERIASSSDYPYVGGWGFPQSPLSWTRYVFYGADIRESAINELLEFVKKIAQIPVSDADNDRIRGLFFATHEVDGMLEWNIRDGEVVISPGRGEYSYLDE